jgi:hypothetical protein
MTPYCLCICAFRPLKPESGIVEVQIANKMALQKKGTFIAWQRIGKHTLERIYI